MEEQAGAVQGEVGAEGLLGVRRMARRVDGVGVGVGERVLKEVTEVEDSDTGRKGGRDGREVVAAVRGWRVGARGLGEGEGVAGK